MKISTWNQRLLERPVILLQHRSVQPGLSRILLSSLHWHVPSFRMFWTAWRLKQASFKGETAWGSGMCCFFNCPIGLVCLWLLRVSGWLWVWWSWEPQWLPEAKRGRAESILRNKYFPEYYNCRTTKCSNWPFTVDLNKLKVLHRRATWLSTLDPQTSITPVSTSKLTKYFSKMSS